MPPVSPYQHRPRRTFWRTAVSGRTPVRVQEVADTTLRISPTDKIVTAGSCFAQHIAARLKGAGFNVLDYEPAPRRTSTHWQYQHGYGIYSARYGNIYYVRQLLQLVQESLGMFQPAEAIWQKDGRYFDALRPSVEPEGFESVEEVAAHRAEHLKAVRRLVRDADVFVFTLGLTEGWEHVDSGTVYPTAPGTVAGVWDPQTIVFHNFTFSEILDDLREVMKIIESQNPTVQFLFTVSPVALAATATDHHVMVANSYSKAILRAVVGQITENVENAHYFPSYDMITGMNSAATLYEENQRSVHPDTVDIVMRRFMDELIIHESDDLTKSSQESQSGQSRTSQKRITPEQQLCEDSLLEDFA
ncbi:MAG: GSCFA domain-containing protein [Kocuria sp.]|nr:GSCFA domain-containing protein [Kocuria sp.]